MKWQAIEVAMVAGLAGAGCVTLIAVLRRAAERQRAVDGHLKALAATVETLQARVVELSRRMPATRDAEPISAAAQEEPEPKTLAVLTAAATAFLGRAAQIRSVRRSPAAAGDVSPWSQQGRVIVQTSHNPRGRE